MPITGLKMCYGDLGIPIRPPFLFAYFREHDTRNYIEYPCPAVTNLRPEVKRHQRGYSLFGFFYDRFLLWHSINYQEIHTNN